MNLPGGGVRVRFRELLIPNITPRQGTFYVHSTMYLNPGLTKSFPWLSGMASRYDQYVINKLSFDYVTSSASVATGFVYASFDYDAVDPNALSATVFANQLGSSSGPIWNNMTTHYRPGAGMALSKRKFIRIDGADRDLVTTDSGKFMLALDTQSIVSIGQLWVEYEVDLLVPQMQSEVPSSRMLTEVQDNPLNAPTYGFTTTDTPVNFTNMIRPLINHLNSTLVAPNELRVPAANMRGTLTFTPVDNDVPASTGAAYQMQIWYEGLSSWLNMNEIKLTLDPGRAVSSVSYSYFANQFPNYIDADGYISLRVIFSSTVNTVIKGYLTWRAAGAPQTAQGITIAPHPQE